MRILIGRMLDHEPWWAEFWSAVGAIAWCLTALAFSPGLHNMPTFAFAVTVLPEWMLYLFGLVTPSAQLWAVRRDHRAARLALAAVMCWWWAVMFLGLTIWSQFTPGMVLYAVPMCSNMVSVAKLRLR